ncbi:TRAP transporter large permease [Azospirillum sp. RWY-5-1]|uniref:TRAP transporter large permease protein n=1 Tax=Azospirillum oleiclasticum TaxID=2735135 RepID=A0ABX2TCE4_9PROT|nr:TRAP transporter large permease [Azospirillum oleiclasticum]NYZ13949.1 TRAP transporter large permease [Azospirillum oleiclasticum]NYZ20872.1 TRAP transporter large permease [Azospirillum oleiclasticum]
MISPLTVLIITFVLLMVSGMPLSFSMLASTIVYFLVVGEPLYLVVQQFFIGIDSFTLLAIPFFMLAGDLMVVSGTAEKMLAFSNVVVGRFRGGVGYVTIVSSMLFGGCSGSAISEIAGLGRMQVRMMERGGFSRPFSTALAVAASIKGAIIPPSIPMVLVGAITGTSIGGLLVGGAVPGVMVAIAMAIVIFVTSRRMEPARSEPLAFRPLVRIMADSLPFLAMPFIILGGILSGVFTPTEAAAGAVGYGFILLALSRRRGIDAATILHLLIRSGALAAAVLLLSGASSVFSWVLAAEKVPDLIAATIFGFTDNRYVILFIINLFLLVWGLVMDMLPAIFIIVPMLMPLVVKLGVDPIHFGVVVVFNLVIGLITPPYGAALFTGSIVTGVPLERIVRSMGPFMIAAVAVLMIITYIPATVLTLPRLFGLD